ncbi:MAG: sugar phosphate isomerase/epimerase [Allomuricauda sp.]|nr:MAG: sugar phosphate isomerase/epimerase [Allomuricauda sp.]
MKTRILLVIGLLFGTTLMFAQEVGIQLYSLRNQFKNDVPSTLQLIKSWGIDKIEGGENTYGLSEKRFIKLLDETGLDVVSVGTNLDELRKNPQKTIDRAKAFGAQYAMCPWIPHNGNDFTIEDVKNATRIFNAAGKLLKEAGVQLVYHPHGYEFRPYEEGTLFDYMAKNAEHFAFEMDIYWVAHGGEDPLRLFKSYPGKFPLMHLKDMKKGVPGNDSGHDDVENNVVLGEGQLEMKAILQEAKKQGVQYMFIEDESSRVVTQVPKSLVFIADQMK